MDNIAVERTTISFAKTLPIPARTNIFIRLSRKINNRTKNKNIFIHLAQYCSLVDQILVNRKQS